MQGTHTEQTGNFRKAYWSYVEPEEVLNNKRLRWCNIPLKDYHACPKCNSQQISHAQHLRLERTECWNCKAPREQWLYLDELARDLLGTEERIKRSKC